MPGFCQRMQGAAPVIPAPACLVGTSIKTQVALEDLVGHPSGSWRRRCLRTRCPTPPTWRCAPALPLPLLLGLLPTMHCPRCAPRTLSHSKRAWPVHCRLCCAPGARLFVRRAGRHVTVAAVLCLCTRLMGTSANHAVNCCS